MELTFDPMADSLQQFDPERGQTVEEIPHNFWTHHTINLLLRLSLEDIPFDRLLKRSFNLILSFPWRSFEKKGCLFIVEEDHNVLVMKIQEKIDPSTQKACAQVPFGRCLCGRAALTREIQSASCPEDSHENRNEDILHSHYCVPIKSAGGVLGVLNMYLKKDHHPDREEKYFLAAAANTLALNIQRKKAEEEKGRIQVQFLHAQKMEAVGLLAGGVAHDFNNILTTIHGYCDLCLLQVPSDSSMFEYLNEIRRASVRATNLTRQLLLFGRRQPVHFGPLDLNKAISDMLKMLTRLIAENYSIITDFDLDLCTATADIGSIEQIIMNLTVNARDAMPEGGEITIKTENVEIDRAYCRVYRYARPGRYVCLSVIDAGVGMAPETMSHIFEPFFTTKGSERGTGLGLAVVYGIVKQHGGWINAESQLGHGTRLMIYFPATPKRAVEENKKIFSVQGLQGNGESVLLIEDEEDVRKYAAKMLRLYGYKVFAGSNGKEAQEIFSREKGNFDLVFCDVVLPDESGIKLVDRFLATKPDLHVLFSSGYMGETASWPVIQNKRYHFLEKPYEIVSLLGVINDALQNTQE
jgi:signal transduction histidine kinase/ActR/RegA family two-component response regulator